MDQLVDGNLYFLLEKLTSQSGKIIFFYLYILMRSENIFL